MYTILKSYNYQKNKIIKTLNSNEAPGNDSIKAADIIYIGDDISIAISNLIK